MLDTVPAELNELDVLCELVWLMAAVPAPRTTVYGQAGVHPRWITLGPWMVEYSTRQI